MPDRDVRILVRTTPEIEFYTAPVNQVPPGYTAIHMRDHGEFFASPEYLASCKPSAFVWPEFPLEVRSVFPRFERLFNELMHQSAGEWEDGFRRDHHPWGEIALWQSWCDGVEKFTAHLAADESSREKRKDVQRAMVTLGQMPKETRDGIVNGKAVLSGLTTLSNSRVREIAKWMYSDECYTRRIERRESLRKLIQGPGLPGPDRVPIDALFDETGLDKNRDAEFEPNDLIVAADLIIGVDRDDNREFLLFGRDAGKKIELDGQDESVNVLRVELDTETDDINRICALLLALKGRYDYGADESEEDV